jgi:23S rRNA pseudouridine2605 synthase
MAEERVQKILARAGYGSRRASEELITAGRVRINGQVAVLGSKADPDRDAITVDNQPIAKEQPPIYIALNKPTGILSEVSPDEPRETVRDLIPQPGHMFIVGRLDKDSEGLILLTNDGEMANRLSHPRYGHEKEYRVLVGVRPDDRQLEAWRHGVVLEDGYRTAPAEVRIDEVAGKGAWLRVILREGRKRQIREMGKQTGVPVLRIQRIRIGSLLLGDLKPGQWRELRPDEIRTLKSNLPDRRETPRPERSPRPTRRPAPRRSPAQRENTPRPASRRPEGQPGTGHPRSRRPGNGERREGKRAPLRAPRTSRNRS